MDIFTKDVLKDWIECLTYRQYEEFYYHLNFCVCLHRSPFAITLSFRPLLSIIVYFGLTGLFPLTLRYLFVDKSKKTLLSVKEKEKRKRKT